MLRYFDNSIFAEYTVGVPGSGAGNMSAEATRRMGGVWRVSRLLPNATIFVVTSLLSTSQEIARRNQE